MAFQEKVISLGTLDTLIFECPITLSGSVHGLVFSNISDTDKNLTIKVYTKSTGVTATIASNRKVSANSEFAWPKPINMAAGDQIIAQANALNSVTCLASVYLAVAQPISAGFVPRGVHSVIENYVPNDVVEFQGSSYVAIAPNINSIPPSNFWMRLAAKGDVGASAAISVKDEGTSLTLAVKEFNFTGVATATVVGDVVTVNVPANTTSLGDLGIPNVENKSSSMIRSELTSSNIATALGYTPLDSTKVGAPLGVAPLGSDLKIASLYLPSYVDDVIEGTLAMFPATGEAGKIYLDTTTNKQYRWSGSIYSEINPSPGSTDAVPEGSTNKYFSESKVLSTVLAGLSLLSSAAVSASDTVVSAFGKIEKRLSDLITTVAAKANSNNPTFTGTVTFPQQAANVFFAGPAGAIGVPTWRNITAADLPALGNATATTLNKVTITAPASGATLTILNGKTLTVNNTLTLVGTDGSSLNIGAGGTLGSAAFTDTSAYAPASGSANYVKPTDIGASVQPYSTTLTSWAGKSLPTGAVVGATDVQTLTNKTFTGYKETVYPLSGTAIAASNGTIQTKTLAAPTTFTESLSDGESVVLMLNPGTYSVTWPTISWINAAGTNTAPTLKASVVNVLVIWQTDGVLYGNWIGSR